MIILISIATFDVHYPGNWQWMFPGSFDRDYAQILQLKNGIIPQNIRTDWETLRGASTLQYTNTFIPARFSFIEGQIITSQPGLFTAEILTDDGVTMTISEISGPWTSEIGFNNTGSITASIDLYIPGATVLPPNSSLVGSGALPQHVWITDAAGTDLGAIVFCPNSYTMGLSGVGGFMNPDYQNVGNYSAIPGFTSNVGVWNMGLTGLTAGGSVTIWGGNQYLSVTGVAGGTPPPVSGDWTLLAKTTPNNGYIEEWDIIEYDFDNNWLQYRADKLGNEFRYSKVTDDNFFVLGASAITLFQWGNAECYDNKVHEGYISNLNSLGRIFSNTLGILNAIYDNTMVPNSYINGNVLSGGAGSAIFNNTLGDNSRIALNTMDDANLINNNTLGDGAQINQNSLQTSAFVSSNILDNNTNIQTNSIGVGASIHDNNLTQPAKIAANDIGNDGSINNNIFGAAAAVSNCLFAPNVELANKTLNPSVIFGDCVIGLNINQTETLAGNLQNKRCESGFSNFVIDLPISGMGTTLVLPPANDYCGIFHLTDTGSFTFTDVLNPPPFVPYILNPANTTTVTLTGTSITLPPGPNKIVLPTTNIVLTGANKDFIQLEKNRNGPAYSLQINSQKYS